MAILVDCTLFSQPYCVRQSHIYEMEDFHSDRSFVMVKWIAFGNQT